jgi:AbrB family looped-hinge helix DNA binding protein
MSRITSKLQVTVPKAVADEYGLKPGSEVTFEPAGDVIVLRPAPPRRPALSVEERLAIFDAMMARIDALPPLPPSPLGDRGWTRAELYERDLRR